jgi:hypothetical protein
MRTDIAIEITQSDIALEEECRVFAEYLLGCVPPSYAVQKYADAHVVSPIFSKGSRFDFFLVRIARTHRTVTTIADAYARIFVPTGLLRKKLVLLLAILETCPPSCHLIDAMDRGGKVALLFRLLGKGVRSAVSLTAGMLLFLPAQMVLVGLRRKTE